MWDTKPGSSEAKEVYIALLKLITVNGNSPPCFEGSWDPLDPWGEEGGRVYSTALMVLCLEVYFRYGKVLGSR